MEKIRDARGRPTSANTRRLLCALVATGALVVLGVPTAGSALASGPGGEPSFAVYQATDANGGLYWRSSPNMNTPVQRSGYGVYTGDNVALDCYAFGGPGGPYGDRLWYWGEAYSGARGSGQGWINDHYLTTPGTAAAPQPQGPRCAGY
jgi:hypothetical protein